MIGLHNSAITSDTALLHFPLFGHGGTTVRMTGATVVPAHGEGLYVEE